MLACQEHVNHLWLYKLNAQLLGSGTLWYPSLEQTGAACSMLPKVLDTTSLEEAQTIMAEHQLQSLPLVDQDGKLV